MGSCNAEEDFAEVPFTKYNVIEITKNPRTGLDCMCKHLLSRGSYQKTVPARANGDTKGNANSPLPGKVNIVLKYINTKYHWN